MPLQFAPPPSFAEPKNLVPEIKLPSVQRPNIPLRNLSTAPDDDDKTRDMMLAMILGASTPLFERGAVALAEKIPGISGLLEPKVEKTDPTLGIDYEGKAVLMPEPSGADRLDMLRVRAKELFPEDTVARQGWVKGQQLANAAIPDSPVKPKDTLTKSAVKMLGGLLPAAALKTSAGAGVFADMYGKGLKAKSDEALVAAQSRLRTVEARKKAASDVSKKYFESQQEALFHFIDPNTMQQKSRNVVQVGQDIFVKSQGHKDTDVDLKGDPVPRGELYLNPIITAWGTTDARPLDEHGTYINMKTQDYTHGKVKHLLDPETSSWRAEPWVMVDGRYIPAAGKWLRVPDGASLKDYAVALSKVDPTIRASWAAVQDISKSTAGTLYMAHGLQKFLETKPGEVGITTTATIANVINSVWRNMEAVKSFMGDGPLDSFNTKRKDGTPFYNEEETADTLRLYRAVQDYILTPNDTGAIRAKFVDEMQKWTSRVNKKYEGNWGDNIGGSLLEMDQEALQARAIIISRQLQLAYRAATTAGQTGRTLSDKDLANFLQIVGYGIEDPEILIRLQRDFAERLLDSVDKVDNEFKKLINNPEATEDYVVSVLGVDEDDYKYIQEPGYIGEQARQRIKRQAYKATGGLAMNFLEWVKNDDTEDESFGDWEFIMQPFVKRFFDPVEDAEIIEYINSVKSIDPKAAKKTGNLYPVEADDAAKRVFPGNN